jgi:hypothetical protein
MPTSSSFQGESMTALHELPWDSLCPDETAELFAGWGRFWCIAGGWALDLVAGRQSREHSDTDVLVLRGDIDALHDLLPGWELYAADPPGSLRMWLANEFLGDHVHDIWCRIAGTQEWRFQLMVMDHHGDRWVYRRNRALGGPLSTLRVQAKGIPVIAPEIQLLFKSKGLRPKDEADFRMMLPCLTPGQRGWLRDVLAAQEPEHTWLASLTV